MTLDETSNLSATNDQHVSYLPYSKDWWEGRTSEELRDIINRGFAGGEIFKGATAEVERRTKLAERAREAAAAEEERQRRAIRLIVLAAVLGVTIAGSTGIWLFS